MLRTYETIYVVNPDVSEENQTAIDSKIKGFITGSGGEVGHEETWGVRNLSFPLKKQAKGKYNYVLYTADTNSIKDIEFYLKISEPVLTFLTVKIKDTADLASVVRPDVKNLN
ncbi:MAG: 30S ribosomal protein S6 [bacterium]